MHCIPQERPDEAFEIINFFNCSVYVADNREKQFTRKDFVNWTPSNFWQRNPGGIRYLTFDESCLFSSPGYETLQRHHVNAGEPWRPVDWVYLANGCPGEHGLGGCFPESCHFLKPKDGSLKWSEISKCHYMKWYANKTVSILKSPEGDQFILHATTTPESAAAGKIFGAPKYPDGWTLSTYNLEKDFLLTSEPNDASLPVIPNGRVPLGKFSCGYVIVADSAGNSFHRIQNMSGLPHTFNRDIFGEILLFTSFHQHFSIIFILFAVFLIIILISRKVGKRILKPTIKSD